MDLYPRDLYRCAVGIVLVSGFGNLRTANW